MKFGIILTSAHSAAVPSSVQLRQHLAQVRAARRYGWDTILVAQHYLSQPYQYLQPIPFLARLAVEGRGMLVGTGILLLPLHNPVDIAEQIASLDVICHGRLIFGVGLGYRDLEYEAFGMRRRDRVGRFVEALQIIQKLWTEDEVNFEGQHFRLSHATMTVRPVQKPHPPIWVAAIAEAAIQRAAAMGHAWYISAYPKLSTLERQLALYRRTLEEAHNPFPKDLPLRRELYLAEDTSTARREARPLLESRYQVYAQWGLDRRWLPSERLDLPFEALEEDRFVIGDPARCIQEIKKYQERLGVNHIIFRLQWPGMPPARVLKTIRLLGEEVLPYFKGGRTVAAPGAQGAANTRCVWPIGP